MRLHPGSARCNILFVRIVIRLEKRLHIRELVVQFKWIEPLFTRFPSRNHANIEETWA